MGMAQQTGTHPPLSFAKFNFFLCKIFSPEGIAEIVSIGRPPPLLKTPGSVPDIYWCRQNAKCRGHWVLFISPSGRVDTSRRLSD